jgi:ribonuclease Y
MNMTGTMWVFVSLGAGFVTGVLSYYIYRQTLDLKVRKSAEDEVQQILNKAKSEASRIEKDAQQRAKDFEVRSRRNVEAEMRKEKQKAQNLEQNYKQKESRLEQDYKKKDDLLQSRMKNLEERSERLKIQENRIADLERKTNESVQELRAKLEQIASLTTEQAREELRQALIDEARREAAREIELIQEEAKVEADKKARRVVAVALSRYASEVSTEKTVASLPLRGEEMKGKIIGREGRNIRALEAACGVDLIVDETPETVVISCFDPVRREVAKLAIEKLIEDGRVHPGRIEEVVEKAKQELFQKIKADGEKAAFDLGLVGIHHGILQLIGSMKYRHADAQNLYDHSIEVAYVAGIMAAEIGEDVQTARRAALLHDLGKAIDHTVEGDAATVGAEFAKRHGERDAIVHAIRSLSGKEEPKTALAHIVHAANAFSESRPGAKRDMIQNFIRRLVDIESIGNSFDGVVRTYALQSGKEVRVMVESARVTDDQAKMLVRDIARKIEREANYPGQIRVSVIRETRMVEHAR